MVLVCGVITIAYAESYDQVNDLLRRCIEEKSIELCNRAIDLQPEYPISYTFRAELYISMERYDDALTDLQKSLELHKRFDIPENALLYYQFCVALHGKGEYYQAIKSCDKAINLYDKYPFLNMNAIKRLSIFIERGFVYAKLQNYTMAIKDFTEAIKDGDPTGEIQLARAWAIAKNKGNPQDFFRDLHEGCPKFIKTGKTQVFIIDGNMRELCLNTLKGQGLY